MPDAAPPFENYGRNVPWWRRPLSLAIAVLINLLLLFMLIEMTPSLPGSKNGQGTLTTFNVSNDDKNASSQKKQQQQQRTTKAQSATKSPAPKLTVEPPKLPTTKLPSDFIQMSSEEFASADVSKMPSHGEAANADAGGGEPGDTPLAGGSGPHGEPLYAAEWYREPTQAEIGPYLSKTRAEEGNWGEIACKTVARYHVDDCVALYDSPPGTHIAVQIQDAAFQFLVRPPRVGGKTLVGAWVRIRITISNVVHDRR